MELLQNKLCPKPEKLFIQESLIEWYIENDLLKNYLTEQVFLNLTCSSLSVSHHMYP